MSKKRGSDLPDGIVYALAVILVAVLFFNIGLLETPKLVPITGLQSASASLEFYILGVCSGPLTQGWNLVSLCNNVSNNAISVIFSGIDIRYVMRWNETAQEFTIYSSNAASNPFTTMDINRSYMVFLNDATGELSPSAGSNPDMNITLVQGWNTPSFPYEFQSNFTRYFNSTVHRFVMKWNTTTQEFTIWSPRMATPPASKMFIGDGQFIYSEATNTLIYNKTNLSG